MASTRLHWLDWQRGLAVLVMIEAHILSTWSVPDARHGTLYTVLRLLGGMAAPGFLYMAGLSQMLADRAMSQRGVPDRTRRLEHSKRALYVLGVAYTFRVVEYLLGLSFLLPGAWQGILRVDILNVIGVGLLFSAWLNVGRTRGVQLASSALAALALVGAMPLLTQASAGWHLAGYLYTDPTRGFSLANWGAFLLFGTTVGALLGDTTGARHVLALGATLVGLGLAMELLFPSLPTRDFWYSSPAWFFMRLGGTVLVSGLLMRVHAPVVGISWLAELGRHSLFAYMASVELTFGFASKAWHHRLSMPVTLLGMGATVLVTLALIHAKSWLSQARTSRVHMYA